MTTAHHEPRTGGHDHGVQLDDTFDFLNTSELENGALVDHLETPHQAVHWLAERGLIHTEGVHARESELERVREVRTALRDIADAVVEERAPAPRSLEIVNGTIRARAVTELVVGPDGIGIGHRHVGDPVDDALARIAEPLIQELAGGNPERIRICGNDECRWVFYDESRAGRRRWCDMASCGNRAKAARHRARMRAAKAGTDPDDAAPTEPARPS